MLRIGLRRAAPRMMTSSLPSARRLIPSPIRLNVNSRTFAHGKPAICSTLRLFCTVANDGSDDDEDAAKKRHKKREKSDSAASSSQNDSETKEKKSKKKGSRKEHKKEHKKEEKDKESESNADDSSPFSQALRGQGGSPIEMIITGTMLYFLLKALSPGEGSGKSIDPATFLRQYVAKGLVEKVVIVGDRATATLRDAGGKVSFTIGSGEEFEYKLEQAQRELGVDEDAFIPVAYKQEPGGWSNVVLTAVLFGGAFLVIRRVMSVMNKRGEQIGGIFDMYDSKAQLFKKDDKIDVKFADVAGLPEAKQEVMEFVDFLKNPQKYQRLGAKIPKGAILTGPPGTGKTMLAKAAAGEASVPFIHTTGSEFLEVYVGVGPSRVRSMFKMARENAPCIIFIDEIDAIGRARDRAGYKGSNDERENTLNQLLVEMDGVSSSGGVVVMAATNRVDILDKALLRPGRFDRQIGLGNPDIKSRVEIFLVHLKKLILRYAVADVPASDKDDDTTSKKSDAADGGSAGETVLDDGSTAAQREGHTQVVAHTTLAARGIAPKSLQEYADRLAVLTPGFSGADIANTCNEAALLAARKSSDMISWEHFDKALDRVIGGVEKRSAVLSASEKKTVAHHEAGHAVAGWFLQHADRVLKVNIVPRSTGALGYAQLLPKDEFLKSVEQLRDRVAVSLGGRIAEEMFFGKDVVTTGARDDLSKVTKLVYAMVNVYGMSPNIGPLSFPDQGDLALRPYGESTAAKMDAEVRQIVAREYERCRTLLEDKRELVQALAQRLLEKEMLDDHDLKEILGQRPFADEEAPPSDTPITIES